MSSQASKSSRPSKSTNQSSRSTPSSTPSSSSSSLSSHLAMVELKQRILTSLSKLSDRDTHQIAVQDLENIIQTLSNDGVSMLLNCLYDATNDPKTAVKKESLRLLAAVCAAHKDFAATHLSKVIAHVVKRLKDSDTGVRDACRDTIGSLSGLYLKGCDVENNGVGGGGGVGTTMVSLFVKPLFEAMSENNKVVQGGAAMCMAKMVECASGTPVSAFQKLCPRISKFLNSPNFMAKASLLSVVSSLSQVRAIALQSLEPLLQSIHDCLGSSDWATRKAAADTLIALASHSSNLIAEGASSTLAVLEACRFDKIKPARDSITEALQLWKKIAGKGDGALDDQKASSREGENSEAADLSERKVLANSTENRSENLVKDSSYGLSPTDSVTRAKTSNISDKTVGILRKKVPALTDKELNPDFFQKLETRGSDDLPVEVVVPRRCINSLNEQNRDAYGQNDTESRGRMRANCQPDDGSINSKTSNESGREHDAENSNDINQRESSGVHVGISGATSHTEGFINNKLNWLAIQKQLLQLERQQAHLMNMLQDFMGGSHESMVTLENRVRGLERVVEDMARDLTISTGRRGSTFTAGLDGSSNRTVGKYNSFSDYSSAKLGRGSDGRIAFGERFVASDGVGSGMRARGPTWRSDAPDNWDFHSYAKSGQMGTRRAVAGPVDNRSPKSENDSDQVGSRRGWDKASGSVRFGEGPSARSVWQASKDEATLEAIRVAGEDTGVARGARVAIPELTAEALADDGIVQERDPVWTSWSNAMDALHVGDMDLAFAEVLSTGDELLLLKLMGRSGPVIDQLSNETANEVLHAVAQFLLEQNLLDICLSWVQQLLDIAVENGPDALATPMEVKREILLNLNEAASLIDPAEEWEGATPDQLMLQLAAAWEIDLQELDK